MAYVERDGTATVTASPSGAPHQASKEDGVKYYFVFVVLVVILLFAIVWASMRISKKNKAQLRVDRHSALAQDLDGWPNTRRWLHGDWRSERIRDTNNIGRREGFNELGQAPPPYQSSSNNQGAEERGEVALPAPVLSMQSLGPKPPNYEETFSGFQRVEQAGNRS